MNSKSIFYFLATFIIVLILCRNINAHAGNGGNGGNGGTGGSVYYNYNGNGSPPGCKSSLNVNVKAGNGGNGGSGGNGGNIQRLGTRKPR